MPYIWCIPCFLHLTNNVYFIPMHQLIFGSLFVVINIVFMKRCSSVYFLATSLFVFDKVNYDTHNKNRITFMFKKV